MFVRFRQAGTRLQLSILETRRVDGRIRNEHVATLGAIQRAPSVADRIEFWDRLHQRLAKLSNRIDADTQSKILAAVHTRVPMVSVEEQRALQLENAKADAHLWASLHAMEFGTVEERKQVIAGVERDVADGKARADNAATRATEAKDRIARIERGEDVQGGLGKPLDVLKVLREAGWTEAQIRDAQLLASLPEDARHELLKEIHSRRERSEKAAKAAIIKRYGLA